MGLQNDLVSSPLEKLCNEQRQLQNNLLIDDYMQIERLRNDVFTFALSVAFVHGSGITALVNESNREKTKLVNS